MSLHIADFKPDKTIEGRFVAKESWIRFSFFLEGSGYWEWHSSTGCSKSNRATQFDERSVLSYCPEGEARICFPAWQRHFHLSINVAPSLVAAYLDGCWEPVPREFRDICEGCDNKDFLHRGPLSLAMGGTIHHLLECPYSGSMRRLYVESKAMELIAHKLAQISSADSSLPSTLELRPDDMDRLRDAKNLLTHDLENPPGLFELERAVGTNHTKLNRGFKAVFGTTVFGYLRKMRLQEARHLLEEEGMNVTEAAVSVGYNSMSSFSRAFSTYFGKNPKQFQKKRR